MTPRSKTIRKYLLMVIGGTLATFLLFVAASWIWIATLDLQAQRPRLAARVGQALGRDVHIDGPLQFVASVFPRISVMGVRVANPDWAAQADFLTIERLEVEINLWDLLRDRLVIRDIELTGATVHLQRVKDKGATWDFKPSGRSDRPPAPMPDIVALHAKGLSIAYYPPDRPAVRAEIDELRAALMHDEPVAIGVRGTLNALPLGVELRGGTLAALLDRATPWPVSGTLEVDRRVTTFDASVTDLFSLGNVTLTLASEKNKARESALFGHSAEPLVDRYATTLQLRREADAYAIAVTGELHGFDGSRWYAPNQRRGRPTLTVQALRMDAQAHGSSMGDMLATLRLDVTASGIDYQYPLARGEQKSYSLKIDALRLRSGTGGATDLLARGTANGVPVKLQATVNNAFDALWRNRNIPAEVDVQTAAINAHFAGAITPPIRQVVLDGQLAVTLRGLPDLGSLLAQDWPESMALQAQGPVRYENNTLTFPDVRGQWGTEKIIGAITLGFGSDRQLSFRAQTPSLDIHDVRAVGKVADNLVLSANDVNVSLQGRGHTFKQAAVDGAWSIAARRGRAGWRHASGDAVVFALQDVRLDTHGAEPTTVFAGVSHGNTMLQLDAHLGRLTELFDPEQPYPLTLRLTGKGLAVGFQGAAQKPLSDAAVGGGLDIEGQLPALGQLVGLTLTRQQAASLHGRLATTRNTVNLTDVIAKSRGVSVNGDVAYQVAGSPRFIIHTSASRIDLAEFLPKSEQRARRLAMEKTRRDQVIPDIHIDLGGQRELDLLATVDDLRIDYENTPLSAISARLTANRGIFRLDPLMSRSAIDGSTALAKLEIDSTGKPTLAKLELQASKIDYGTILKQLHVTNEVVGTLDLRIQASGRGQTLRAALATADGQAQLVADPGSVPKWVLDLWGAGLLRSFGPAAWAEGTTTKLNCAVGRFDLTRGVMRSRVLLADTERVTVAGEVVVDWRDEGIAGVFKPQSKDPTLFRLGTPIKVGGTLAHPTVASAEPGLKTLGKWAIGLTNPAALIVLFGDVGTKNKNPCAALLEQPLPQNSGGSPD